MRKVQNWNQPCPNKECKDHGQINKGNISSISSYLSKSGRRRILLTVTDFGGQYIDTLQVKQKPLNFVANCHDNDVC